MGIVCYNHNLVVIVIVIDLVKQQFVLLTPNFAASLLFRTLNHCICTVRTEENIAAVYIIKHIIQYAIRRKQHQVECV